MSAKAFIGGAGVGKTHNLMEAVEHQLGLQPLKQGQKVLALTFMHGSRRRLEARLSDIPAMRRCYECMTIDSFAWRIVNRWRELALDLGCARVDPDEYEWICYVAGLLLRFDYVQQWIANTYPYVILDEAQDLTVNRLEIFESIAHSVELYIAADEFQCLDENLKPNPACSWIDRSAEIGELTVSHRTTQPELLAAATALRSGQDLQSGKMFRIAEGFNKGLAGTWLSNQIGWYGRGLSTAIITPAIGSYSDGTISWASENTTKKKNGPHKILSEKPNSKLTEEFIQNLPLMQTMSAETVRQIMQNQGEPSVSSDLDHWLEKMSRCSDRKEFSKDEITMRIRKSFAQRKRRDQVTHDKKIRAMTVHGAKNREFDNVIVLWPAAVSGYSDDQKRRLLYNAVTRAKKRCLVIVQSKRELNQAPFCGS
tara:strand:- start:74 stop:1348 length:1275 start_codon:yes stop_codon:yes gene_type:complete